MTPKVFLKTYLLGAGWSFLAVAIYFAVVSLPNEVSAYFVLLAIYGALLMGAYILLVAPTYWITRRFVASNMRWLAYPFLGLVFSIGFSFIALTLFDIWRFPITFSFQYWLSSFALLAPAYIAGAVQGGVIGWRAIQGKK